MLETTLFVQHHVLSSFMCDHLEIQNIFVSCFVIRSIWLTVVVIVMIMVLVVVVIVVVVVLWSWLWWTGRHSRS